MRRVSAALSNASSATAPARWGRPRWRGWCHPRRREAVCYQSKWNSVSFSTDSSVSSIPKSLSGIVSLTCGWKRTEGRMRDHAAATASREGASTSLTAPAYYKFEFSPLQQRVSKLPVPGRRSGRHFESVQRPHFFCSCAFPGRHMPQDRLSAHPGRCRMLRRRSAHHPQTGRCRSPTLSNATPGSC